MHVFPSLSECVYGCVSVSKRMEIFPSFKNNFQEHFFLGGGSTLANSNQAEEETKVATG